MKYSIIITTFNCQEEILNTLKQLISIKDPSYEVIVVDDGSNDETVKRIESIASGLIKLYQPGKIGRSKALNYAIRKSAGEFIFINDADDFSFVERFHTSVEILEKNDVIIFGKAIELENISNYSYEELRNIDTAELKPTFKIITKNNLYRSNQLHHSTMALRRSTLKKLNGYNESLKVCIDLDFYFKALSNNITLVEASNTFIVRNIGGTRKFAAIPSDEYIHTLLQLRKRYRTLLKPNPWFYIWDIRLFLVKLASKLKKFLNK